MMLILWTVLAAAFQGQAAQAPAAAGVCTEYPTNLESCTAFACTFRHPFTGQTMERRIVGLQGELCATVEQMPNNGRMECSLTPAARQAMAEFLRAADAGGRTATSTRTDMATGASTSSTTVEGRPAANPLNDALQSGACTVTGYGAGAGARGPAPAAASSPVASTATGTLSLRGEAAALTHVRAIAQPDRRDRTKQTTLVVMANAALTPAQTRSVGQLQALARAGQLRAVSVEIGQANDVVAVLLYGEAFGSAGTVSLPPASVRFTPAPAEGGAVAGTVATVQPITRLNVPIEFSLTFSARAERDGASAK